MNKRDEASTFAKGLAVLECFEGGRLDLTMAQIGQLTGYDRATTRRLCLTLESGGYVLRDGKTLRLTPKVLALAGGYLTSESIGRTVQPILNKFAEELQGEIALLVRDGTRAIFVARSAVSAARLSIGFCVGSTLPLLPTATGRMLLAGCDGPKRASIIDDCILDCYTSATDLDLGSLRKKIEQAAAQGYAYAENEFEMGAAGVAVPIQPISGKQAVLATTASVNHMTRPGQLDAALDILRRAAMSMRR